MRACGRPMRPLGPVCSASTSSPSFAPSVALPVTDPFLVGALVDRHDPPAVGDLAEDAENAVRVGADTADQTALILVIFALQPLADGQGCGRLRPAPDRRLSGPAGCAGRGRRPAIPAGGRRDRPGHPGPALAAPRPAAAFRGRDRFSCASPDGPRSSSSFSSRFRSIRAAPLMPNARAMSRLAVSVGFSEIQVRISSLVGILLMRE